MNTAHILQFIVLLAVLILSVICIREPMKIARAIVWWAKLVSGGFVANPDAREAIDLMENHVNEYERRYTQQLAIIRLTGWVGLFVSLIGSCILIAGR